MKIKRFNEKIATTWNPDDVVVKCTIDKIEVELKELQETEAYHKNYKRLLDEGHSIDDAIFYSIPYALEEWIFNSGSATFNYDVFDGNGNKINDIDAFITTKKYNL